MKIVNYAIAMQSQHEFKASYVKVETLNLRRGRQPVNDQKLPDSSPQQWLEDELKISRQAKEALKNEMQNITVVAETDDDSELSLKDKQKIQILESFLSALFGRKFKFRIPKRIHTEDAGRAMAELQTKITNAQLSGVKVEQAQARQGWGFVYERQEFYQESERLSFNASGIIKTADGREINFGVQLNMSREFAASNQLTVKAGGALLDPLVINYDGPAAQLTDVKYQFDLDSDGQEEQISFLKEGSGFLAIDHNGDGVINNGKELFGPTGGNGFAELAQYDQDQNGWIDENDSIFNKLRIWTKDSSGQDTLFALGQKGIGAIFLGNISAEFGLKDTANQLLGQAKTGGVFIKENGTAGTIQQLDLVV
jgi:hypothetical protein